MKYKVKNWEQFQQYKDDRPLHWIKFHNSLLDDFSFNQLSESLQLQLLKLWLVASKNGGNIEGDEKWLAQLTKLKKVEIDQLVKSGFIIRTDVSTCPYETVPREEKRREEESREEKSIGENNIVELKRDESMEVFEYWQDVMNHKKAAFDAKRKTLIKKWFKHYSVDDLKKAIYGCSVTPYNMGDNRDGRVYDSIELILRDSKHIDDYMRNADNPPAGGVKTIQQTRQESANQANRVMQAMGLSDE